MNDIKEELKKLIFSQAPSKEVVKKAVEATGSISKAQEMIQGIVKEYMNTFNN